MIVSAPSVGQGKALERQGDSAIDSENPIGVPAVNDHVVAASIQGKVR